jgi:hypothetical protein
MGSLGQKLFSIYSPHFARYFWINERRTTKSARFVIPNIFVLKPSRYEIIYEAWARYRDNISVDLKEIGCNV